MRRLARHAMLSVDVLRVWLFSRLALIRLRLLGVQVGSGLRVSGWIRFKIHEDAVVSIGNRVKLNCGFRANPVAHYHRMAIYVGKHAQLRIGDDSGISSSTIVCMSRIDIGDRVLIGGGCNIFDTDFHATDRLDRRKRTVQANKSPVAINDEAFVGANVTILKGSVIGEGAVIGAGALVSTAVPADEVWGGNPARRLRSVGQSHERTD